MWNQFLRSTQPSSNCHCLFRCSEQALLEQELQQCPFAPKLRNWSQDSRRSSGVSSLGIGIYSIIVLVLRLMWFLCYVRCGQWFQQIYLNRFSSILARLCLQQAKSVVIHVLAVRSLIIEKDRATSASPSPQKLGEAILPEVGKLAILLFWMGI